MSNGKIIYESLTDECKAIINNVDEFYYNYLTESVGLNFLLNEYTKEERVEPKILFNIFGYSVVKSNTLKLKKKTIFMGSVCYNTCRLHSDGKLYIDGGSVTKDEYKDLFLYFKEKYETKEKEQFSRKLKELTSIKSKSQLTEEKI